MIVVGILHRVGGVDPHRVDEVLSAGSHLLDGMPPLVAPDPVHIALKFCQGGPHDCVASLFLQGVYALFQLIIVSKLRPVGIHLFRVRVRIQVGKVGVSLLPGVGDGCIISHL